MKLYGPSLIFHLTNVHYRVWIHIYHALLSLLVSTSVTQSLWSSFSLSLPSWVQLVEGFGDSMVKQKFWSNGWMDAARLPIWCYRDSRQATDLMLQKFETSYQFCDLWPASVVCTSGGHHFLAKTVCFPKLESFSSLTKSQQAIS